MGLTRLRASQISNIDYKQATRVITVANIALAGGAPAVVDGVSLSLGDRVLVTGQTTASQNGLYDVAVVGAGADGTWERTSDGNQTGEIEAGMIVMVTEGVAYHDTQWKLITDNPIIIGSTALTFEPNTGSSYSNANVAAYLSSGNVSTAINTTSTISASGNVTGGNVLTGGSVSAAGQVTGSQFNGSAAGLTAIPGANVTGTVANATTATTAGTANSVAGANVSGTVPSATTATTAGTVTTAAQPTITSVGTLTALAVTGNVSAGNVSATTFTGALSGAATSATTAGTVTTAAQPNITSVGTLTALTVTGNVTAGNLILSGAITDSAQLDIQTTAGNANIVLTPNGTGNVNLVRMSASGNVTAGNVSVGTGTLTGGNIVNSNANGVGNIGSATTYFNTVFAKATSAQYADLAEMYSADAEYAPGTVVVFGGPNEITINHSDHDTAVAGVVSTNPSYLMNSQQQGEFVLPVALTGRVPCQVQGPVNKGTVLVTGTVPGTAAAIDASKFEPGCVLGKSLETITTDDIKTIEVAVGRL